MNDPDHMNDPVTDTSIISIADFGFTYAATDRPALKGIDLHVAAGEYVGIIGLNGAGKTTLGLCLNGVVPNLFPGTISGRIVVGGRDPQSTPVREMARTVGIVLDDPESQMSQITVGEEVALGLENLGVPPDEMPERIAAALALVGLDGLEERSPLGLSGGQQQRLAIAAVLAMRPSILFMDEPTSSLDPVGKAEVFEIARRLNRDDGMTILVAEHEVEILAEYADRIVVLDAGRIAFGGTPAEVLGRVDELAALGLRVPQVTALARAVDPAATALPLTVEAALDWLAVRS